MKRCTCCKEEKSLDEFFRTCRATDKRHSWCKICHTRNTKAWYARNPEKAKKYAREWNRKNYAKIKARRRLREFGIDEVKYQRMLAAQGGKCSGCWRDDVVFCVDHCHKTGAIRGLLCHSCNLALGHATDDVQVLLRLAEYLVSKQQTETPDSPAA